MTEQSSSAVEREWVAVNMFGDVLADGFDTEDSAWDWLEGRDNYTGFAEPAEWHEAEA